MMQSTIFETTRLPYKPIMTINMAWQMTHIAILSSSEKRLFDLPPNHSNNTTHTGYNPK